MNHSPTGKVDCFDGGTCIPHSIHQAIDTPDHVGQGEIDDKHPSPDEEEDGREFNPLGNRADN